MSVSLEKPTFPALRDAADDASAKAQSRFMLLIKLQLSLLCIAAFLSGIGAHDLRLERVSNWSVFAVMLVTLGVTSALRVGKFDDRWFRCRAYAENFKSAAWLFVMSSAEEPDSESAYLAEIEVLRARLSGLDSEFAQYQNSGSLFTSWMRYTHGLSISGKLEIYRSLRLEDQIDWYTAKAKSNQSLESKWFWAVFCTEFVAVACAAFQAEELLKFNPVSGIAALGTLMIAWAQTKRFSDLATSYAIAAGDLKRIAEAHVSASSQADVDAFASQVEVAVSREHSMWMAKRLLL